jgi:hypothetical protein
MRIRSPMTEPTTTGNFPGRRVFRMLILLVLVLLLMQRAADPQVYRNFFNALGAPLERRTSAGGSLEELRVLSLPQTQLPGDSPVRASGEELVPLVATVAMLGDEGRTALTKALAAIRQGNTAALKNDPSMLLDRLASAAVESGEIPASDLTTALEQPGSPAASEMEDRLQRALDDRYWTETSDATVWQPQDVIPFYRALEKMQRISVSAEGQTLSERIKRDHEVATQVGFASLADQPAAYRGKRVVIDGTVARVEEVKAEDNPFGIRQLWLVWLRPMDGSERPVMGYVTSLPKTLEAFVGQADIQGNQWLRLDGIFLRRQLYRSVKGSELAPVIAGRIGEMTAESEPFASGDSSETTTNSAARMGGFARWVLIGLPLLFAVGSTLAIAYYTAKVSQWRRRMRQQSLPDKVSLPMLCFLLVCFAPHNRADTLVAAEPTQADLLSMLPGIDAEKLQRIVAEGDHPGDDAARLLYAIGRISQETLDGFVGQVSSEDVATELRAIRFRGRAQRVREVKVNPALAEMLELNRMYVVTCAGSDSAGSDSAGTGEEGVAGVFQLVVPEVPRAWLHRDVVLDEPVSATAVELDKPSHDEASGLGFATRLRWYPDSDADGNSQATGAAPAKSSIWPLGWRMLSSFGFDCGQLSGIASRARMPLVHEEIEPFYGMLRVAADIQADIQPDALPERIVTVRMLKDAQALVGEWIQVDLETARFSRILLTDAQQIQQLGQDYYWQVDAFGELTNVRIELEAAAGSERLVFENRFPVSLAILHLPDTLKKEFGDDGSRQGAAELASTRSGRVDMKMQKESVTVNGFFYRLWSFESDYTESRGGRQVAPLIIASTLQVRSGESTGTGGVGVIGWGLMTLIVGGMVAAFVYQFGFESRNKRRRVP